MAVRCRFVAVTVGALKSSVTVKLVPSSFSAEVRAMTLPPESTMSMDEAPASASEPSSTAQAEKVASPNVASGSTPELSAGASAMTSAEARSRRRGRQGHGERLAGGDWFLRQSLK